jgi:hypothetical protein
MSSPNIVVPAIVTSLLSRVRDKLDKLAETLLHEETVNEQVLEQILGAKKQVPGETERRILSRKALTG